MLIRERGDLFLERLIMSLTVERKYNEINQSIDDERHPLLEDSSTLFKDQEVW